MWTVLALTALAEPSDPDEAYARVREAELQGRWEEVATACDELRTRWPDAARAEPCQERLDWLSRRRDTDGGLAGWGALEAVRRTPGDGDVDRVEAVRAAHGTSPVTRAEASAWLAYRALEDGDAERALDLVDGADPLPDEEIALRLRLEQVRAEALAVLGRDEEALATAPEIAAAVRLERRRWRWAMASGVVAGLFLAVTAPYVGAWRDLAQPRGLWPLVLGFVGAAVIGAAWEAGSADAVPWALAGAVAVHALALPALHRLRSAPWRQRTVRALAALATVALAYLAGWWTGTLGWVGL
ncbi:MAG: hypothetical protein H6735_13980 [Alphaproteobacteria bacterium]|nr:hypothetical protein [Alphaproteobacteria bacterium]